METGQLYQQPFQNFPSRTDHANRWRELAQAIAAKADQISHDPDAIIRPEKPGELTILGSGIETVGFTSADEIRIREADKVFYCVADPATVVWLKRLRPDAYDLYVLYDDTKIRYTTYMQMTEAMLHFVREGQNVVAIFYGHPGVFVLSTHRAVQIGQREGHKVTMRAGISALDTLCADLGIDPSQPGMQTFEATDTLIRKRHLDPELHLILWQVGLVGDLGYRREGSLNSGFSVLLDYLEETYGPDHEVVNYIGSRYPGADPVRDRHTISSLRNPAVQSTITGISTFYIPPAKAGTSDPEMLLRLGLLKPGQNIRHSSSPMRVIDEYGPKERKAFSDFAHFDIPTGYHWQEDTAAARFILALREDGKLRTQYCENPRVAMSQWAGGLSENERRRLSLREAGAMQLAAKGLRTKASAESVRMLQEVLTREPSARALLRTVRAATDPHDAARQWSQFHGFNVDWAEVPTDLHILLRKSLYPWTGCYLANDRELSIVIHGQPSSAQADSVYVNGIRVQATFSSGGIIHWQAGQEQHTSGLLHVDRTTRGTRRLVGAIWTGTEKPGTDDQLVAAEHHLPRTLPLASLSGHYRTKSNQIRVRPDLSSKTHPMAIYINDQPAQRWSVNTTSFEVDGINVSFQAREPETAIPDYAHGTYQVRLVQSDSATMATMSLSADGCYINSKPISVSRDNEGSFSWKDGPATLRVGQIKLLVDPITLSVMLFGTAGHAEDDQRIALRGMIPVSEQAAGNRKHLPDFGLPEWAWRHLVDLLTQSSEQGGLFLWHGWNRSANNLRRLRSVLKTLGE
ncbi:SAM-dependent methyltransferase [Gynuella sunshinyii]|uniref:Protein containing tetrapyrrole methyltransferase domain and MazG-like (Predicted pyrophosphatase) domain n=1 Tax=Gynuella sunshinyii YC6258 TaxID=1445510 RepID=A0A0C5V8N2_9GAMM|nr:SAM-dependent methyltransferase [Gynuella sunshinyii]AJQ95725.1 protein containing tetrapyrrole methyltransferase domain and MazG-like (predicted pyrophosphatase) domain [Gynuella sunshinyii YC6258]